jgi:Flp pilus assembly protein TadG
MITLRRGLARSLGDYAANDRGSSAVEFALWFTMLIVPFLNVFDLGFFMFQTMQVRAAAQSGAQTIETVCGYNGTTPVASTCTALNSSSTVIQKAVQSGSLGANVTLASGTTAPYSAPSSAPFEGWYCNDTTGALVLAKSDASTTTTTWLIDGGAPVTQPADCHFTIAGDTDPPGDYVVVTTNYTYNPVIGSLSVLGMLRTTSTITQTAWMRVN